MPLQRTLAPLLRRLRAPSPVASVGPHQRAYVIGDIHGRADLLRRMHDSIRRDAELAPAETAKRVIYLGDYIDRGLQSKQVLALLLEEPMEGMDSIHLKGNHEELLLRFLEDATIGAAWFALGGAATASSYGLALPREADDDPFEALRRQMRRALPKAHLAFLRNLRPIYQLGDYCFVHAGIRPGVPLEQQRVEDMLWIRDDFLAHQGMLDKIVVHGHSVSYKPEFRANRIGIDTGAYATNILSCLILDGADRRLISTA